MTMQAQRFGVEIEFTGITRKKAAEVVAEHFGTSVTYSGAGYDTRKVSDQQRRVWKVMSDSSVDAQRKEGGRRVSANGTYKCELVTPILSYADIDTLQEIVRKLRKAGAFANATCGIHIHVDAAPHTAKTLRNLMNMVASKEDMLYRALGVNAGRYSYCKKADKEVLRKVNAAKPSEMRRLEEIWYGTTNVERHHFHYDSSRYHGVNLHSTFTKGTVEFRLFNAASDTGNLHAGEIKAYIQLCLAISHQALTQSRASYRPTSTDNEKYAFRCWLLRLGMIGDEFKTARHHLLKRLEGNSAWRNGRAA